MYGDPQIGLLGFGQRRPTGATEHSLLLGGQVAGSPFDDQRRRCSAADASCRTRCRRFAESASRAPKNLRSDAELGDSASRSRDRVFVHEVQLSGGGRNDSPAPHPLRTRLPLSAQPSGRIRPLMPPTHRAADQHCDFPVSEAGARYGPHVVPMADRSVRPHQLRKRRSRDAWLSGGPR
jgi:hypothetical protein